MCIANVMDSQSQFSLQDDRHAIRRLKRGDIDGLEILVARYQAKAVRVAFLITHDGLQAGDTQACLVGESSNGTPLRGCDDIQIVP
jgi:hypothetical protein